MKTLQDRQMRVLVIGEILWDIIDGKEFLGGAALNFSANVQRLGGEATLITAVGDDDRGRRAIRTAQGLGVGTQFIQTVCGIPTGIAIIQADESGGNAFQIPRPAAFDRIEPNNSRKVPNPLP